jgi:hypothetical protein
MYPILPPPDKSAYEEAGASTNDQKLFSVIHNELAPIVWSIINDGEITAAEIRLIMDALARHGLDDGMRNQGLVEMFLEQELKKYQQEEEYRLQAIEDEEKKKKKEEQDLKAEHLAEAEMIADRKQRDIPSGMQNELNSIIMGLAGIVSAGAFSKGDSVSPKATPIKEGHEKEQGFSDDF